ncbi:MAG: hypothetical protein NC417_01795 [Candidatus Gastranaerophilales bacterium]|nr:hypothetical protein [Candidatus Gastranaerophilales bacterium]
MSSIIDEIEAEYDAYCLDEGTNLDTMYEKLYRYLRGFIAMTLRNAGCSDENVLDEVTQETLTAIATDKIYTFHKKEAKFTTFCTVIAKNKAFDYVRRSRYRLCSYSEAEENELFRFSGKEAYCNPEKFLIRQEQRLEQIEAVKKYLHKMVSWKGKPYRTVGCCYTMILFHRHHPDSKELSSPQWAFETVREDTVEKSADHFIDEMNEWFPRLHLYWGDAFLDGMEEMEKGVYVSDMIFGEHFKVKDFENWSLRLRQKMREELLEEVCEAL